MHHSQRELISKLRRAALEYHIELTEDEVYGDGPLLREAADTIENLLNKGTNPMSGPIKPSEIGKYKTGVIPEVVFEVFNRHIALNYNFGSATVDQDDVVDSLVREGFSRNEIYDSGWLNVEEAYRAVGWKVEYSKPGYNETGSSFFRFSQKQRIEL